MSHSAPVHGRGCGWVGSSESKPLPVFFSSSSFAHSPLSPPLSSQVGPRHVRQYTILQTAYRRIGVRTVFKSNGTLRQLLVNVKTRIPDLNWGCKVPPASYFCSPLSPKPQSHFISPLAAWWCWNGTPKLFLDVCFGGLALSRAWVTFFHGWLASPPFNCLHIASVAVIIALCGSYLDSEDPPQLQHWPWIGAEWDMVHKCSVNILSSQY